MKITVFTPTYNRGYIISKLYESLRKQSFQDFEWLIIDDGSSDNTEQLVENFLSNNNFFSIVYLKVTNGGKHRAINRAVQMARGELFYIVDSDDFLPDNALELVVKVEESIPVSQKKQYAGVCGIKAYPSNVYVGNTFSGKYLDITMLEREKYDITGDKAEVFYTKILKKFPFPEFQNEKFLTECVVWDKIAYHGYLLRFFNEIVYYCDYLEDGLTKHYDELYSNNPKGYGLYIYQSCKYNKFDDRQKHNEVKKYVRTHYKKINVIELSYYLHMNIIFIIGYIFEVIDIFHLPNRLLIAILGKDRYEFLKRKIKRNDS